MATCYFLVCIFAVDTETVYVILLRRNLPNLKAHIANAVRGKNFAFNRITGIKFLTSYHS